MLREHTETLASGKINETDLADLQQMRNPAKKMYRSHTFSPVLPVPLSNMDWVTT